MKDLEKFEMEDSNIIGGCPRELDLTIYKTCDKNFKFFYFIATNYEAALEHVRKMMRDGFPCLADDPEKVGEYTKRIGNIHFDNPREDLPCSIEMEQGKTALDLGYLKTELGLEGEIRRIYYQI